MSRPSLGALPSYFGSLWGALALASLALPAANHLTGALGVASVHRPLYGVVASMAAVLALGIVYTSRERLERHYFPEPGFEEPAGRLTTLLLAIWPLPLAAAACLVGYGFGYEGLGAAAARGPLGPAARQSSVLLLVPYVAAFAGLTAAFSLVAVKEGIRRHRLLYQELLERGEVT